jgi:hypothetical protein
VEALAAEQGLDPGQTRAAAAIASTEPLVVVEGAAGAGKTTMLTTAIAASDAQGRATRVLTPTKKAADVVARELGVPAESVAKLLHAHGWRWNSDGVCTRLAVGDHDPETSKTYGGPPVWARLARGERIVVDEAGMLDQDTALALVTVADQYRATLALVGDRAQLAAVGRGGTLDIAAQLSPRVFDMTTVHRFTDPDYADLTVRMRTSKNPALLFDRLHALGLVVLHESTEAEQETLARDAREGNAITVATNDEARELNSRIRANRVQHGDVDDTRTTTGNDGLSIGAGDVIQTRKNDSDLHVANRQTWTVQAVASDGTVWAKESGTGRKRQRIVRLPAGYLSEYTHLAYAATVYGVQGATVDESHTVLTDALDAPGVYVGMTRGRHANRLHIVASDVDDACEQFVAALDRDRADRGLAVATQTAREAVAGLAADGPVLLVNTERARLTEQIARAESQAGRWERAALALDNQAQKHQTEANEHQAVVAAAEATAGQTRAEVAIPLIERATADRRAYLSVRTRLWKASDALRTARGHRKRTTARALTTPSEEYRTVETAVWRHWGSTPQSPEGVESWAVRVAQNAANADPRMTGAQERMDETRQAQRHLTSRQMQERADFRRRLLGNRLVGSSPHEQAHRWREQADAARRDLSTIEGLSPVEAAKVVRARAEQEKAQRGTADRDRTQRQARAAHHYNLGRRTDGYGTTTPDRGLGL